MSGLPGHHVLHHLVADLRSSSWAEIRHRALGALERRTGRLRRKYPDGEWDDAAIAAALEPATGPWSPARWHRQLLDRTSPWAWSPSRRGTNAGALAAFGEGVLTRADRVVNGDVLLFGAPTAVPSPIDWHRDPVSGVSWPAAQHWLDTPLASGSGDVRRVWEVSRQRDLFVLGRAYWLTGDERYAAAAAERLASWLDANPPERGVNWASNLEVALRAIAWTAAVHFFAASRAWSERLSWRLLGALGAAARHVAAGLAHTEACMPGNHVVGDAAGLAVVGLAFPEFRESGGWRRRALAVLEREAATQFLECGTHVEEAPGYHAFVWELLALVALVARRAGDAMPATCAVLPRAGRALLLNVRPDGSLQPLGDADEAVGFDLAEGPRSGPVAALMAAAFDASEWAPLGSHEAAWWLVGPPASPLPASTPPPLTAFTRLGVCVRTSWAADAHCVFVRTGSQSRHTHADGLHVELVVDGVPVLTDAGTGVYNGEPRWRDYFRHTRAHNTIEIAGRPQARPHRAFRWASAATVLAGPRAALGDGAYVDARLLGYDRRRLRHGRLVVCVDGWGWLVIDRVGWDSKDAAPAHDERVPDLRISWRSLLPLQGQGDRVLVGTPGAAGSGQMAVAGVDAVEIVSGSSEPIDGWHSPRYGTWAPSPVLVGRRTAGGGGPIVTAFVPHTWSSAADGALVVEQADAHRVVARAGSRSLHVRLGTDGIPLEIRVRA